VEVFARRLRTQGRGCEGLGSPLYGAMMERAAEDVEAGGPVLDVLAGHETDPGPSALALRLFGQVHRLALAGEAPALAAHYPSTGGDGDAAAAWVGFRALVADRVEDLRARLDRPVQTNEVGRSAALIGGYQLVARSTGLPLRCLEVGTSGGLNLRWDRYRYGDWGDPSSPVSFPDRPPLDTPVAVVERRGCDRFPVDAATEEGRLTLLSFLWPDQTARFERAAGAIAVARAVPAVIEEATALEWAGRMLATPAPGVATVVAHSVVAQYLGEAGWYELLEVLNEAGARATADAPLAHLRMEPVMGSGAGARGGEFEVRLTTWPGGEHRLLARCSGHGPPVEWLGGS
jgi:hypothetical protein